MNLIWPSRNSWTHMSTCSVFQYLANGHMTSYRDANVFCCGLPTAVVSINIKRPYLNWNALLSCYNIPVASALYIFHKLQPKVRYPDCLWVMSMFLLTGYMVPFHSPSAWWCFSCNRPHSYSLKDHCWVELIVPSRLDSDICHHLLAVEVGTASEGGGP